MAGTHTFIYPKNGKLLFLIILLCFFSVLFIRARLIFIYTPNIGGIEQNVIYSIQNLASGAPLYTDPEKENYSFTQYSPLYLQTVAYTGKWLGLDPGKPIQWYRLSRIFSLIFNLLLIFVVFKTLKLLEPDNSILTAGLALLLFVFFEQQDYSRPDSLYHLFFALTLYVFFNIILQHKVRSSIILSGIFLALSVFSKQSAVFFLLVITAVLIYLPWARKQLHWFLISLIFSIIILKILLLQAPAPILIKNLYWSILNGFDIRWAIRLYFLTALPRFVLFFLTITLLLVSWKDLNTLIARTITLISLFYLLTAFVSGLKWGSGTNYFFEFCILVIPGLLLLILYYRDRQIDSRLLQNLALAALITMVVPQLLIIGWRDFYKNDPDSYFKAEETAVLIKHQPWFSERTRFIIPERKWMSNFFFNKTLFAQPDIYRTLWKPETKISLLHPSYPNNPADIYLIRIKPEPLTHHFTIDLEGFKPVMKNDPYVVLAPGNP